MVRLGQNATPALPSSERLHSAGKSNARWEFFLDGGARRPILKGMHHEQGMAVVGGLHPQSAWSGA